VRRALAVTVALAGCHVHRDTNAPGLSDVENPPADPAAARVAPGDPGEEMLAINPGVLAGGGGRTAAPHGFGEFGVEVSLVRGSSPTSHREDDFFVYPLRGVGAALGWSALELSDTDPAVGPLYGEAYAFRLPWGAGGGWAWNPATGDHGPQAFVSLAWVYLRGRYLVDDDSGELTIGFQGKIPIVWVWSR
jgi:hypothetical protein